jgi:hypothetical protein
MCFDAIIIIGVGWKNISGAPGTSAAGKYFKAYLKRIIK